MSESLQHRVGIRIHDRALRRAERRREIVRLFHALTDEDTDFQDFHHIPEVASCPISSFHHRTGDAHYAASKQDATRPGTGSPVVLSVRKGDGSCHDGTVSNVRGEQGANSSGSTGVPLSRGMQPSVNTEQPVLSDGFIDDKDIMTGWDVLMSVRCGDGFCENDIGVRKQEKRNSPCLEYDSTHNYRHRASTYSNPMKQGIHENSEPEIIDLTTEGDKEEPVQKSGIVAAPVPLACRGKCDYLEQLTEEQNTLLQNAFNAKSDAVIAHLADARIVLRGPSFQRLRGDAWLDDEIINGFGGMVNGRNRELFSYLLKDEIEHLPNTYMFSSFFFQKLSDGMIRINYAGVKRWTTRANVAVGDYDLLLFPIHVGKNHWALGTIDMTHQEIGYVDPLYKRDEHNVASLLKKWLCAELKEKRGQDVADGCNITAWAERINTCRVRRTEARTQTLRLDCLQHSDIRMIPSQEDGSSCGVFALKIADCLWMGIAVYFNQKNIALLRKKIGLDIIRTYLPL